MYGSAFCSVEISVLLRKLQVTGSSLDPGATLLLLTPKPSASPQEALAANIAARCLKLQEEAATMKPEGLQWCVYTVYPSRDMP